MCTTVIVEFRTKCNIYNYLILHTTHVVWFTSGRASDRKNSAPILFINTLEEGMLGRGSLTLSENGL